MVQSRWNHRFVVVPFPRITFPGGLQGVEGLFLHNEEPKYFSLASGTNSTTVAQQSMKYKRRLHLDLQFSRQARFQKGNCERRAGRKIFRHLEWNRCGVMSRLHGKYCSRSGHPLICPCSDWFARSKTWTQFQVPLHDSLTSAGHISIRLDWRGQRVQKKVQRSVSYAVHFIV